MNNPDLDKLQQFTNYGHYQYFNQGETSRILNQDESSFSDPMRQQINASIIAPPPISNANNPEINSKNSKKARRSKNDADGRNYECKICKKSYLGSSSLYLHLKSKHPIEFAKDRSKLQSNQISVEKGSLPSNSLLASSNLSSNKIISPIIYGFYEAHSLLCTDKKKSFDDFCYHPLYSKLYEKHLENLQIHEYRPEHLSRCKLPPAFFINKSKGIFHIQNQYDPDYEKKEQEEKLKLIEETKKSKCCDEIFTIYLNQTSQKLEPSTYEKLIEFMLLFRELLNKNGKQILKKKLELQPDLSKVFGQIKDTSNDFCIENGAEIAPEICNEFVMKYLPEKKSKLSRKEAIDLTKTFCEWLFKSNYTKIKIMQESA